MQQCPHKTIPSQGTFLFLQKNPAPRPDNPTANKNPPVFPKNNFIIKAHPPITPIWICQRGPRDRNENRTKKGAAHTRRLPPEIPAWSACQCAAGNVPAKNAHYAPVVRRTASSGQKTAAQQKPGLHRGGSESPVVSEHHHKQRSD